MEGFLISVCPGALGDPCWKSLEITAKVVMINSVISPPPSLRIEPLPQSVRNFYISVWRITRKLIFGLINEQYEHVGYFCVKGGLTLASCHTAVVFVKAS